MTGEAREAEPRPLPPGECTSEITMALALGFLLADRAVKIDNLSNLHAGADALGAAMAAAKAQHGHREAMAAFNVFALRLKREGGARAAALLDLAEAFDF
jgi:hypothetical protein